MARKNIMMPLNVARVAVQLPFPTLTDGVYATVSVCLPQRI